MTVAAERDRPLVDPAVLDKVKNWQDYVAAKLGFRNHWYPTLFCDEVREGQPVPFELAGENLLLNRVDGKVFCLVDRCLHRGVAFSRKLECYTKETISCWYHGWTYRWDTGALCAILTDATSKLIGTRRLRSYAVREAKGLCFVFLGDIDPVPLHRDVPPGFLDDNWAIRGMRRKVNANWRIGAENGFDTTHIFIHKDSRLIPGNHTMLPLGFAPDPAGEKPLWEYSLADEGPVGIYDLLADAGVPNFEGTIDGKVVRRAVYGGDKRLAREISLWLPGVLKVDPFPDPTLIQFEWYVPCTADTHWYLQTLGREVSSPEEEQVYDREFQALWKDLGLRGFNDDDIWAREATQPFYADDWGWVEEQLFESDSCIVAWRKLASEHHRGIQGPPRRS